MKGMVKHMKRHCRKKKAIFISIYKLIIVIVIIMLIINYIFSNTSFFYNRRIILPFSFQLNRNKLYLLPGEEYRLFSFGRSERVEFASTNFNVAEINFVGIVKAYKPGKTYIIARSGRKQMRCLVYVIDINKKKLKLSIGRSYRLKIRGTNSFVSWKSSNESVATVSIFGRVRACGRGTAIIYAKVKGKQFRTEVIVK